MFVGVFLVLLGDKVDGNRVGVGGAVAVEVYGYIAELATLAKLGRLSKPRLARARVLMGLLREAGFLPSEISEFVGGRWKADAVRRYGLWSGVADMSRRDAVIGVVAGLVAGGYGLEDVVLCTAAKKQLDKAGITFNEAIGIGLAVLSAKASVMDLSVFSVEVRESQQTLSELETRKNLADDLDRLGLTREVQLDILGWAKGFGGEEKVKRFLAEYPSHSSLIQAEKKIEGRIEVLKGEVSALEGRRAQHQSIIDGNLNLFNTVNALIIQGWNPVNLDLVKSLTEKHGGLSEVLHALNKLSEVKGKVEKPEDSLMNINFDNLIKKLEDKGRKDKAK
jgi:hypothetical protein